MADWIPQRAEELTPEWLDEVLREGGYLGEGRVVGLDVEPMGEGLGFVGQVLRLRPTYEDAPAAAPVSTARHASPEHGAQRTKTRKSPVETLM